MLELSAVVLTLLCVWLSVRQNIWCWPTGIVGVSLYGLVFFESKLYADMALQAVYVALSIYGWYEWLHGGKGGGELEVTAAPNRVLIIAAISGAISAVAIGATLERTTDASLPYLDSALTSFSLVAQWMLTRKYLENWIVWLIVDVVYVLMFLYKKLHMSAGLYVVFMILVIIGYREWKRTLAVAAA